MASTASNPANNRTPSPPSVQVVGKGISHHLHQSGEGLPSPHPASVSSTTSSEPSSRPGSSNNLHTVYAMSSVPNPFMSSSGAVGAPQSGQPQPVTLAPAPGSWGGHAYDTVGVSMSGGGGPLPPPPGSYAPAPVVPAPGPQYHPHYAAAQAQGPPPGHAHHPGHPHAIPMVVSTSPHLAGAPAPPPPTYYHHPPPPHQYHPQQQQQHPVQHAPAPPQPPQGWPTSRENSCPNFSMGTNSSTSTPATPIGIQQKGSSSKAIKSPTSRKGATNKGAGVVGAKKYASKSNTNIKGSSSSTNQQPNTLTRKNSTSETSMNDGDDNDISTTGGGGVGDSVTSRRQKRLERNRESARLSRRRRKQYLEILEERVTHLSTEVDQGRRAHAAQSVAVTVNKRRELLEEDSAMDNTESKSPEERVRLLEHGLGRTSPEMMLVTTFKLQQLKSFSLPPQSKFVMWLTLQNDQYFRGGRAASERLSAARIGERMLNSGNDRVPPAQSMWPLFCNEIGLSYDQEERVRNFQRTLLQSHESWLERHTARSADLVMASTHDSTQAVSLRLGQRERSLTSVLTPEQKLKFLGFAEKNRERLKAIMDKKVKKHMETNKSSPIVDSRFEIDNKQHVAANLYIMNYRLQKVMQVIPRAAPLVTGSMLMKLSRRPSFESLGRSPLDQPGADGEESMSREQSFASSGSLKRSQSTLSMEGDRPQLLQISPDDAEETCKPSVEEVLGHVKEIIPSTPPPQYAPQHQQQQQQQQSLVMALRIPSPAHVISQPYPHQPMEQPQMQYIQHPIHPPPAASSQSTVPMSVNSSHPDGAFRGHRKQSSFIPPYLNVVPEEMFPNDGSADDFLMSLVDDDWNIGEGIEMDTSHA